MKALVPSPEPLPPSFSTTSVKPGDGGRKEDLDKLIAEQAALRKKIKTERAEQQIAGRGRGGKGRGGKGRGGKDKGGKDKGEKDQEHEKNQEGKVEEKKTQQEKKLDQKEDGNGKGRKRQRQEKQQKEVEPTKEPKKPKGYITPFKSGVKVRNPHGSPNQRKSKRESKAKASLMKLKRMKSLLPALKHLPLPEDETKMNFS